MSTLQTSTSADLNLHAICLCSKCLNNLILQIVASNVERLSMISRPQLLDLAACKSFYIGCDVVGSDGDRGYASVFEGFGNVHLSSTGNEDLDATRTRHGHYTSNEAEDVFSLLLWTFIQSIKHYIYLRQILDE
jgi:hypothetical protein